MTRGNRDPEIEAAWSRNADAWTRAVREGMIESRRVATDDAVLRCVMAEEPERVLDVGCGEGWLSRAIAERGVEVVGFDGAGALVEEARRRGGGRFVTLRYDEFVADPGSVGGRFDAAVCNFSLFSDEIGPLLGACRETLRDAGRLIVQTVHPWAASDAPAYADGWREESFAGLDAPFRASMPWYFRTLSTWAREITGAGYGLAEVREPLLPDGRTPASLILVGRKREPPPA